MRLFLAIELTDPVRRHLVRLQEKLRPLVENVSWTKAANLHLTLKFLGEVDDNKIKPLCDDLAAVPPSGQVELTPDRLTCFPERGMVRVIGAGLNTPLSLLQLVSHIESTCKSHGFRLEGRPYTSHITLARARDLVPAAMRKKLEETAAPLFPGPSMVAEQFTLVQSQLRREGAVYTPAAHFVI